MEPLLNRPLRWILGLPDPLPTEGNPLLSIDTIEVQATARRQLLRHVDVRGRWHGGALLGTRVGTTLHVSHVTRQGPYGSPSDPVAVSPRFVLGSLVELAAVQGVDVDWVGQWIGAPDGRPPSRRAALAAVTRGAWQGLFDERHPLLAVGVREGYLVGQAYTFDDEPVEVVCPLGPLANWTAPGASPSETEPL